MKKVYLICGIIFLVVAIFVLILLYKETIVGPSDDESDLSDYVIQSKPSTSVTDEKETDESVKSTEKNEENIETEPVEEYLSPIDFEKLQKTNPDGYAWLEIEGADISYPIFFKEGDNSFYLNHNIDGEYDKAGALFTEDYNSTDFSDPATVIYGHNMASGAFFGLLEEKYSNPKFFKENNKLNIYMPTEMRSYKIFAALPFSDTHILHYYNFSNNRSYDNFLEDIYGTRSLEAIFNTDIKVTNDDKIVILLTCRAEFDERYLVLAVEEKHS